MSKFEFLPLGGVDDKGNNCYALIINDDIFVVNTGIYFPSVGTLGVEGLLPDFQYLIDNKHKIKGIFIGTPIEENIGGLQYLLSQLDENVKIYTSIIGKTVIESYFDNQFDNIVILKPMQQLRINNIIVLPFNISNTLPCSLGFIFNNNAENYIYTDDSVLFLTNSKLFSNNILDLSIYTKNKNNILICSSGQSDIDSFACPKFKINTYIKSVFDNNSDNRIIFGVYSYDFYKIYTIITLAYAYNRCVLVLNIQINAMIETLINEKIIDSSKIKLINEDELHLYKNAIVIMCDTPHALFTQFDDLVNGDDQLLILDKNDTFCFISKVMNGWEKKEANFFDDINKNDIKSAIRIDKSYIEIQPCIEDIKFMVKFFQPNYIIPINNLYLQHVELSNGVNKILSHDQKVLIPKNGKFFEFDNCKFLQTNKEIKFSYQPINLQGNIENNNDINNNTLLERKIMQEDGIIVVNFLISEETKTVLNTKFESYGIFSNTEENNNFLKQVINETIEEVNGLFKSQSLSENKMDNKEIKRITKKFIEKQFNKKNTKTPMVVVIFLYNKY